MRILPGRLTVLLTVALATALQAQSPESPQSPAALTQRQISDTDAPSAASQPATTSVSEVRIVRLSEIKGETELDRNTGRGFEPAFANLPIVAHAKLRTGEGVAEVEFEDNSSLRLTPHTVVEFPLLGRTSSGATLSTIHLVEGSIYVSLTGSKSKSSPNQFNVSFASQTLNLAPATHFELSLGPKTRLAVFEGSVDVPRGAGTITVEKKKELLFDPADPSAPTLLSKLQKGPFDEWDKTQVDYHVRYSNASAFGGSSSYGISDLNYYGSFASLPGCGNVWRPYFASAAWDPYANGVMAWYPNAGYSWVSPYPWGWTPFHSGSWQQCGAAGWGWQPGGQWTGLRNFNGRAGSTLTPTHPVPPAPLPGHPTLIPVSKQPLASSRLAAPDTFVFNKDSAGLGVPRETFGKLSSASNDVARHGAVVTQVDAAPGLVRSSDGGVVGGHSAHSAAANGAGNRPASGFSAGTPMVVSPRASSAPVGFPAAANLPGARSGANFPSSVSAQPASRPSAPMQGPSAPQPSSAPSHR